MHGGQWPDRETLLAQHREAEYQYLAARKSYRHADDASPDGQRARLRVLRYAALCLVSALSIQAIHAGTVVSGTLRTVTLGFSRGGLSIPGKQITQEQVIQALFVLLRHRETHPEANEDEEIQALFADESSDAQG